MEAEDALGLHNDLLYQTIAIDYLSPEVNNGIDLRRFRGKCRNYITKPVGIASKTCEELLEELEKMGIINVGHYEELKELVRFNVPLVNEIEDVERAMNMKRHKKTRKRKAADMSEKSECIEDVLMRADFFEIVPLENEEYDKVVSRLRKINRKMLEAASEITGDPDLDEEYHEKCNDFSERFHESAKLLRLFYYIDGDHKTKHGKKILTFAKEGQKRLDTEDFSKHIENWRKHNELLKNYIDTFRYFTKKGAKLRNLLFGSIFFFFMFESREKLEIFISEYHSGVLQQELQEILITEEFLRYFRLKSAKIEIYVELEEYLSIDGAYSGLECSGEVLSLETLSEDETDELLSEIEDEQKGKDYPQQFESERVQNQSKRRKLDQQKEAVQNLVVQENEPTDKRTDLQKTTDDRKTILTQKSVEIKAILLQETDESETVLRQETDECGTAPLQASDESEIVLQQTADGRENVQQEGVDEKESVLQQAADESETALQQTKDESETVQQETKDESETAQQQTKDESETALHQTKDESETVLRQTRDESETVLQQATYESEIVLQQTPDEPDTVQKEGTDEKETTLRQAKHESETVLQHIKGESDVFRPIVDLEETEKYDSEENEGFPKQRQWYKYTDLEERTLELEREHGNTSTGVKRAEERMTEMDRSVKTEMAKMEGRVNQTTEIQEKKISQLEQVAGKQDQEIKQLRDEQSKARTDISQGDINKLRKELIEINDETTKAIPLSPLQEGGDEEMPIELLYASVVIHEDPKYARKEPYSSQHKRADPGDNKTITSVSERIHRKQNISKTPEFDIGSYNYDSHSDSHIASTSRVGSQFSKTYDPLSRSSRFLDSISRHTREVTNPDDILKIDGKVARNIYMLGDAAHGKTTYCFWLLKKWCNSQRKDKGGKELDKWEKALHEFDFVFLLQFRNVNQNLASVIDMICQNVFASDTGCHKVIRHVLSSDKYRSLIIMDGLDEWNPNEETRKQLTCKGMPNIEGVSSSVSCFFSMRPWVFHLVNKVKACDRVIEILGLSKTGMKKVIKNVLKNRYKLKDDPSKYRATYNKIVRHLKEKSLKSFMQIPLLAVVCVQIWYKEKQVGDSMTSFYAVMLNMLIERAYEKHELKTIHNETGDCKLPQVLSERENITNHISVLLKLGKVAYKGLLSKETNLVFQKRKLQKEIGEKELQFALDVGLISQKEAPSLVTKNVSVHFFHKSIQEFLAVIYIVTQKEVSDLFFEHLSNVKVIMELSNVITFICGMCPSLGRVISQCVVSVTDSDREICKYRELPWGGYSKVKELYKLQLSWYREFQYGQTYSLVTQTDRSVTHRDRPVTHTDRPVTFHVSDVYLDHNSDTETVRVTRELLSDHHVDIRSLYLYLVPTDGERGITNTALCDFLSDTHRTRSLVALYINGDDTGRSVPPLSGPTLICDTGRSVPPLCVPSLRCLYLYKVTINTDLCGNICPPLLTDMSQVRVLVLKGVTLGEGGLGLSPDMVHIERIELWDVNLGEGGLGLSPDMVHIKDIELRRVTLGEGGLGLYPDMVHIKEVTLWFVFMPAAGWGEFVRSVSHLQHRFNVELRNTNIDDVSLTKIRSSPDFTVTQDGVDKFGRYVLKFTRVWPPSQLTQGNVLLYTRMSQLIHDDDDDDDDGGV